MNKYFFYPFFCLFLSLSLSFGKGNNDRTLKITEGATEMVAADKVAFQFTLRTASKKIKDAMMFLEEDLKALKKTIKNAKLNLKNLNSSHYNIQKRYDYHQGRRSFKEFELSIGLSLTIVNSLKKIEELIVQFHQLRNIEMEIYFQLSEEKQQKIKKKTPAKSN